MAWRLLPGGRHEPAPIRAETASSAAAQPCLWFVFSALAEVERHSVSVDSLFSAAAFMTCARAAASVSAEFAMAAATSNVMPCLLAKLDKPARDRLKEIEFDDVEELMSFRIAGAHRVWCVQSGHIMRVLWWDPNHQVYVVPKDRGDRAKLNKRRRNR